MAINRRCRSFSHRRKPTNFATRPRSTTSSLSVTKVEPPLPPPPPPGCSSSQDIHCGMLPLLLKKDKLHMQHESDETTVSLTCSNISSFSNHSKTKKEEVVSKSNIGNASNTTKSWKKKSNLKYSKTTGVPSTYTKCIG